MAGAGMSVSSRGGRRPVDAAINLVPFIDLLSCCISLPPHYRGMGQPGAHAGGGKDTGPGRFLIAAAPGSTHQSALARGGLCPDSLDR